MLLKEILVFITGIMVGSLNSVGGGGMLLGFPILLATGLTPLVANITTNLIILPGQLASAYGYRRYLRRLPPIYLVLLIPCILGGAIGAILLRQTSSNKFEQLVPVLIIFAVILFCLQPFIHRHLTRHISTKHKRIWPIVIIAIALLPTAIYGGYFGAGFGFIMLAFLSFTSLKDIHQMNGLKNIAGACIAAVSIACLLSTHLIDWPLGLAMACGNAIGGYGGARMSQHFSAHVVRIIVIAIGMTAAVYLVITANIL